MTDPRQTAESALRDAERETLAGIAFKLFAIDEYRITENLFRDPAHGVTFIALTVFRRNYPAAKQVSPSGLIQFVAATPELRELFSDEVLPLEGIPAVLEGGHYHADLLAGNVHALKQAAIQREWREKIAELDTLPSDRRMREMLDWVERLRREGTSADPVDPKTEFDVLTAAELDAGDFPINFLIEDIMVEGQPCVVAAPKKSLKTNVMIDATLSLASGSKFLDTFYVPQPKRVAMISGESGKGTIQETARRIAKSKPWSKLADYPNSCFAFNLPNFGDDRAMRSLREFVRQFRIEVLIVDPAYLCLPLGDDAGNLFKVGQILLPFSRMAQDENITPVIVHHFIKATAVTDAPPEMESIAWAGFQEWARQWVLMSRRSRYDADKPGFHELWFAAGGSAGHSVAKAVDIAEGSRKDQGGRKWEVAVKAVGDAIGDAVDAREQIKEQRAAERNQRQQAKDLEAVRQTLKAFPTGISFSKLRDESSVRGERLNGVLAVLRKDSAIEDCTVKAANKQEYDGVRLVTRTLGRTRTHSDKSELSESAHITRTDTLSVGECPSVFVVSESENGVTRTKSSGRRKPARKKSKPRKGAA